MTLQEHFSGRRCLITGGTGFIGGRLAEVLAGSLGSRVRVLMRDPSRASRVARFPIEFFHGDIAVRNEVERASEGCDFIFHCAYGNIGDDKAQRLVTVGGTENVLAAAWLAHVKRIVHVSTVAVYDALAEGELDESAPRARGGAGLYATTKLEAELRVLSEAKRGLSATVVQPTIVYGPWGPAWTLRILNELKTGRAILVNGGNGLCNAVYIDDVVRAMLLAAIREEAVGEHFLISGPAPVTWREFYEAYERLLGFTSTVSLSAAEAMAQSRGLLRRKSILREAVALLGENATVRQRIGNTREVRLLLQAGRAILSESAWRSFKEGFRESGGGTKTPSATCEKPIHPLLPSGISLSASRMRVKIDKAMTLLGYRPQYDFAAGMERLEKWARWANMVHTPRS